jgi:hypothetical protein
MRPYMFFVRIFLRRLHVVTHVADFVRKHTKTKGFTNCPLGGWGFVTMKVFDVNTAGRVRFAVRSSAEGTGGVGLGTSRIARTSDRSFDDNRPYFVLLIPITSSNSSSVRKYCHQLTKKMDGEGKGTSSLSASTPRGRCFCCNSLIVKYSFSSVSNASSRSRVWISVALSGQA